jgi:hypothetical protein
MAPRDSAKVQAAKQAKLMARLGQKRGPAHWFRSHVRPLLLASGALAALARAWFVNAQQSH